MPYSWNSTAASRMCNCSVNPRYDLAWKCPRCKKINAPWKGSCDCTPTPFGAPTSSRHLIDEIGHWNFHGPHYNPYWDKTPTIVSKEDEV
jgi:hypothetical protein